MDLIGTWGFKPLDMILSLSMDKAESPKSGSRHSTVEIKLSHQFGSWQPSLGDARHTWVCLNPQFQRLIIIFPLFDGNFGWTQLTLITSWMVKFNLWYLSSKNWWTNPLWTTRHLFVCRSIFLDELHGPLMAPFLHNSYVLWDTPCHTQHQQLPVGDGLEYPPIKIRWWLGDSSWNFWWIPHGS